jgi:hypothetical protein
VKAKQQADATNTNINFFISISSGETPRVFELTTLNVFRPQRTTVLFAIVAEPVEKPDARFLALDCHSPPTPVSQSISLDHPGADNRETTI